MNDPYKEQREELIGAIRLIQEAFAEDLQKQIAPLIHKLSLLPQAPMIISPEVLYQIQKIEDRGPY